jgi:hypothetical protein
MSFQLPPASSSTSRTFSNTARHCVSISYLRVAGGVECHAGYLLLPACAVQFQREKQQLPTRFAWWKRTDWLRRAQLIPLFIH